jgi:hypothetical protein
MTVIHLGAARDKIRWKLPDFWRPEETAELLRLCAVLNGRGVAASYELIALAAPGTGSADAG